MNQDTEQYRAHGHLFEVRHVGTGGYLATTQDYEHICGRGLMRVDAVNQLLDALNEYPVRELEDVA